MYDKHTLLDVLCTWSCAVVGVHLTKVVRLLSGGFVHLWQVISHFVCLVRRSEQCFMSLLDIQAACSTCFPAWLHSSWCEAFMRLCLMAHTRMQVSWPAQPRVCACSRVS